MNGLGRAAVVAVPVALAAIPPALIVALVATQGVNVPWFDQWDFVPALLRGFEGRLSFSDLWANHNEHRLVLPKLVMLVLARLTDWDVRYEMFAGVATTLATLVVLGALIRLTVPSRAAGAWLLLLASAMLFSTGQFENWLWGWQLQVFMNVLAACVMVLALTMDERRRWALPLAVLAALAGTLSFASGLALVALLPIGVWLDPRRGRARLVTGAALALIAVVVTLVYLAGLQRFDHQPDPVRSLAAPGRVVHYLLVYLGAPLGVLARAYMPGGGLSAAASTEPAGLAVAALSLAWGVAGLAIVIGGACWFVRRPAMRAALLPWLLLAGYVTIAGTMAALGRSSVGVVQAMSSRYTTVTSMFWVSVAVLAALAMLHVVAHAHRVARRAAVSAAAVALVALTVSYVASAVYADPVITRRQHTLRYARECLTAFTVAPDGCLGVLLQLYRLDMLRQHAAALATARLGPFADGEREPPLATYTAAAPGAARGALDALSIDARLNPYVDVVVGGWAAESVTVLIVLDGEVLGRTSAMVADGARPRWTFRFPAFRIAGGQHQIAAYALASGQIVKLEGDRALGVK